MRRRSQSRRSRLWWLLGIGLILGWAIWFARGERLILDGPAGMRTLPFEVRSHVALGHSWDLLRPGSLRLVCTSAGEVQLVLQTRLPARERYPRSWRNLSPQVLAARLGIPGDIKAILYIDVGRGGHGLSFPRARFVAIDPVDTFTAGPLSSEQVNEIASWMDEGWRKHFGFMVSEYGIFMNGFASGGDVRRLAEHCAERP
jgi:hypothetical protein